MADGGQVKILLLEDDKNLGAIIEEHLKLNGFNVTLCSNGEIGLKAYKQKIFDLCLVDIMMPKVDGFTFARTVRQSSEEIPIVFLTAKSLQEDKIEGFKIGCDDYITKPFSIEELLLRIRAVLKRVKKSSLESDRHQFTLGSFNYDSNTRLLTGKDQEYKLTSKEAELLKLLCLNINQILTREDALRNIWGDENYFSGRSMDVFISRLRKYLSSDQQIEIVNIHSKGFRLNVNS